MQKNIINNALKLWYLPLVAGIILIALGIWTLFTPFSSFLALTVLVSVGLAITGLLEVVYAFSNRKRFPNWGWYFIGGLLNLIVGSCLAFNPGISAFMLSVFIGLWLLFRSVMAIINAFEIKRQKGQQWGWVFTAGVLGVFIAILLLWNPVITGITIGIWMGIGLITVGLLHILISVLLRRVTRYLLPASEPPRSIGV